VTSINFLSNHIFKKAAVSIKETPACTLFKISR
jgi:hypothetical protein